MIIREIEEKDNEQVESVIRTCLVESRPNKPNAKSFRQHLIIVL
jgi:hypothetical protein